MTSVEDTPSVVESAIPVASASWADVLSGGNADITKTAIKKGTLAAAAATTKSNHSLPRRLKDKPLGYAGPLPVQAAVIPAIARSLRSGLPMDFALSAPTGSGKTLCFLLPMVEMVLAERRRDAARLAVIAARAEGSGTSDVEEDSAASLRSDDSHPLRGVLLVPTAALAAQIADVLRPLVRGTGIRFVNLCGSGVGAANFIEHNFAAAMDTTAFGVGAVEGEAAMGSGVSLGDGAAGTTTQAAAFAVPLVRTAFIPGTGSGLAGLEAQLRQLASGAAGVEAAAVAGSASTGTLLHFSTTDLIIGTPQLVLRALATVQGLSLHALRMLVVDEADQVLTSAAFTSMVNQIATAFVDHRRAVDSGALPGHAPSSNAPSDVSPSAGSGSGVSTLPTLTKVLCSATMTTHITRIADLQLHNCCHFSLASDGTRRAAFVPPTALPEESGNAAGKKKQSVEVAARAVASAAAAKALAAYQTKFAMPPQLHEHMVIVEDRFRHAALLKVVLHACGLPEPLGDTTAATAAPEEDGADEGPASRASSEASSSSSSSSSSASSAASSAASHDRKQKRRRTEAEAEESAKDAALDQKKKTVPVLLVFCDAAESARVMAGFLKAAGLRTLEFTAHAVEGDRRRALAAMRRGCEEAKVPLVVVTTDALMRGIDLPGIRHVIMYDPPRSLPQYIHRVGRTARGLHEGHAYCLLSRLGPSGTIADGQVAHFNAMNAAVDREQPLVFEAKSTYFVSDALAAVCQQFLAEALGSATRQALLARASVVLSSTPRSTSGTAASGSGNGATGTAVNTSSAAPSTHPSSGRGGFGMGGGRGGRGGGSGGRGGGRGFGRGGAVKRSR